MRSRLNSMRVNPNGTNQPAQSTWHSSQVRKHHSLKRSPLDWSHLIPISVVLEGSSGICASFVVEAGLLCRLLADSGLCLCSNRIRLDLGNEQSSPRSTWVIGPQQRGRVVLQGVPKSATEERLRSRGHSKRLETSPGPHLPLRAETESGLMKVQ